MLKELFEILDSYAHNNQEHELVTKVKALYTDRKIQHDKEENKE